MRFFDQFKGLTITERGHMVADAAGLVACAAAGYGIILLAFGPVCPI